jgi:hypothetical protein
MAHRGFPFRRRMTWTLATRHCGLSLLLALAIAPCAVATTYKWVDERGQVNYSDTPPSGITYEIVPDPHHVPAPPPPAAAQAPAAPGPAAPPQPAPTAEPATLPLAEDGKCVDALYQIALLGEKRRAFKPGPNDTRIYIEDRDRPAEIERLSRQRDENCSDEQATRMSQQRRAAELMQTLSPDCQSAREKMQNMLDPSTRTPDSDIERQRAYLQEHCPGAGRDDLWMADWMVVQRQWAH